MMRLTAAAMTILMALAVLGGCASRDDTEFVFESPTVNDQGTSSGQRACMPDPDGPSSCNY
ncbi:hypothetical protein [Kushneria aurantia]|uniref:Lipoprotein n=1 Tax=Kushneria aurantia TaxID=504092 RepID=A0ABV6G701_9GAMM|nr:hypothetical protein [Kushneria aurantia]